MAVVLDSDDLPKADRAGALISAMAQTATASYIGPENGNDDVAARLDVWTFGATSIFRAALSGIQLERTARQARSCPTPNLAIAVQEIGVGLFDEGGEQRIIGTGQLMSSMRTPSTSSVGPVAAPPRASLSPSTIWDYPPI
jgi:hypothetical protein